MLKGMGRYYLIATLLVVAFGTAVFGRRMATLRDFDVQAKATGTPTPTRGTGEPAAAAGGKFIGEGPWVLSALPGCFVQQQSLVGTTRQLTFDVPPARERVAPGTTLRSGNCLVMVRSHDIWVVRGADRLRVPPEAQLYRTPKGLTLVYAHDRQSQIRVYAGAVPGT